jgi:hypothetical protein
MNQPKIVHVSVKEAVARVIADCRLPRPFRGARDAHSPLERKLQEQDEFEALYFNA